MPGIPLSRPSITALLAGATEVRRRMDRLASIGLAHLPTPLEPCPRLTAQLGGPDIQVKRDDCTGLALGGNKTRQLEYVLGDALQAGADCVIQGADPQSNHARQLAAAGAKVGLDVCIIFEAEESDRPPQGNHLVTRLMGATIYSVPPTGDMAALKRSLATALEERGRRPYIVGRGARRSLVLAAVSYIQAFVELLEVSLDRHRRAPDWIYTASQGSTQAGLLAGAAILGVPTKVMGIVPVSSEDDGYEPWDAITLMAQEAAGALGYAIDAASLAGENTCDYVGPGFGTASPEGYEAMVLAAGTEGIVLDPIYSAKAMAALVDHVERGRLQADERVVFLHTGGVPAIFAHAADLRQAGGPGFIQKSRSAESLQARDILSRISTSGKE